MTAPTPTLPNPAICRLIYAEWLAGRNTYEIGRTLDLHEAVVAEVLKAVRDRRVAARRLG